MDKQQAEWWRMAGAGQEHVKRAVEVACVAGVNVMLTGSDVRGNLSEVKKAMQVIVEQSDAAILVEEFPQCPCGHLKSPSLQCLCDDDTIGRYYTQRMKAAWKYPVCIGAAQPMASELLDKRKPEMPDVIAKRISEAIPRFKELEPTTAADLSAENLSLLHSCIEQFTLMGREITVALRLADAAMALEDRGEKIEIHHLAEALQYLSR